MLRHFPPEAVVTQLFWKSEIALSRFLSAAAQKRLAGGANLAPELLPGTSRSRSNVCRKDFKTAEGEAISLNDAEDKDVGVQDEAADLFA